jgi:hypothetical protein
MKPEHEVMLAGLCQHVRLVVPHTHTTFNSYLLTVRFGRDPTAECNKTQSPPATRPMAAMASLARAIQVSRSRWRSWGVGWEARG